MIVAREVTAWQSESRPLCAAVGFFDGVHRGHRQVIAETIAESKVLGGHAWVLTFEPHPLKVLNPAIAPRLITGLTHKLRLLEALGVDGGIVIPFTRELAALSPEQFVELVAGNTPGGSVFFVGQNWRFGKERSGDATRFARLAGERGCLAMIARSVLEEEDMVSSTRVRESIARGDLTGAARLLGREFSVEGTVVKGAARGRELGYPTANIDTECEALPPYGIYAARVRIDETLHDAVLSYGVRPTFERDADSAAIIEVHLLDHARDLYGERVEVFFLDRIREERAFDNVEALKAEMARDLEAARALLATENAP